MIRSLHALVTKNGNIVAHGARPATVARYLQRVKNLADYQVVYWLQHSPHRVTGEGFLALYEAGHIPTPRPMADHTLEGVTPCPQS